MAIFKGNVKIRVATQKGVQMLTIAQDANGKFNAANVAALVKRLDELSKKEKLPVDSYAMWEPKGTREGCTPVLILGSYGKPKIVWSDPEARKATGKKNAEWLE